MDQVIASRIRQPLDSEELPQDSSWGCVPPASFCSDWRGQIQDPERETAVQILWSPDHLYIRFRCRYRTIFVYEGANGRRDKLWLRDVAEFFIRPEKDEPIHYKEFEISPNGQWLDLDISPGEKSILLCDLKSRVVVDREARIWTAEMGIPFDCLTKAFDRNQTWGINFFRIEGEEPDRFYSAWQPTFTPQPNFHVPEAFGKLYFAP